MVRSFLQASLFDNQRSKFLAKKMGVVQQGGGEGGDEAKAVDISL